MKIKEQLAEALTAATVQGEDVMIVRQYSSGYYGSYNVETADGVILARDMSFGDALFFKRAHQIANKASEKVNRGH